MVMMSVFAMFFALRTRFGTDQLAVQVTLQRLAHSSFCTGAGLDAHLLKKIHGAVAHATGQHYIYAVFPDKCWNLSRSVLLKERVR